MKDFRTELRWGIIFSLVSMIWVYIEKNLLNWHDEHIAHQLGYHFIVTILLFFIFFYLGIKDKKKNYYKGRLTWKQGVVSGGMITVIIVLLSPLTVFFIYHYITPDYFEHMIAYQTGKELYPMEVAAARRSFNMTSFIINEVSTTFSFGIGISALLSLFLRTGKKNNR